MRCYIQPKAVRTTPATAVRLRFDQRGVQVGKLSPTEQRTVKSDGSAFPRAHRPERAAPAPSRRRPTRACDLIEQRLSASSPG